MYLAYIDSSGRPTRDDPENFVLATLISNEQLWQYMDNGVQRIKLDHFPKLNPDNIELHAKDMLNRSGFFKGLTWDEIYSVFNDIFEFLARDETDICVIAVVVLKQKMHYGKDIEKWGYRLLVERINLFLKKNAETSILAQRSPEFGIMIIDSCGYKPDNKLRRKITEMLKRGTYYSDLGYLIEDPLFTDSKWRNLSQLVDCIAYAVRKHFRNPPKRSFHDDNWEKYYQLIKSKFDTDEIGKLMVVASKYFHKKLYRG